MHVAPATNRGDGDRRELEDIGWGTADHWMRMQASYELAQARRSRANGRRCAHAWRAQSDLAHRLRSEGSSWILVLVCMCRFRPTANSPSRDANRAAQLGASVLGQDPYPHRHVRR